MLCAAAGSLLLLWPLFLSLRPRLRDPSSCGKCGYNLTGNVSGICPECGTPVSRGELRSIGRNSVALLLFKCAVGVLIAGVLAHLSFVITYIEHIVDPNRSPYGHAGAAFGDAGRKFMFWCLQIPTGSVIGTSFVALPGIIQARREGSGEIFRWWMLWIGCVWFLIYLGLAYIHWFFD